MPAFYRPIVLGIVLETAGISSFGKEYRNYSPSSTTSESKIATMSASAFSIQLFGPLRILIDGDPLPRLRPRSVEGLLALLILRQGWPVERSWLAGTLWPDSEETQALHNLRNGLLVLRKALGRE